VNSDAEQSFDHFNAGPGGIATFADDFPDEENGGFSFRQDFLNGEANETQRQLVVNDPIEE